MGNKWAPWLSDDEYAALEFPERVLQKMRYFVDLPTQEDGPPHQNRGELVDMFNAHAGAPLGSPWCCSMLWWCCDVSGGNDRPSEPASTHDTVAWATKRNRIVDSPERGDLVIYLFTPTEGHATQCVENHGDGTITIFAGNTNEDGSRDGFEAARKVVPITDTMHFVRIAGLDK